MTPMYSTWQTSDHNMVECILCHSDPGLAGTVKTKALALKEVYLHFTGAYQEPITIDWDTSAFTRRCLRCHNDISGKGTTHSTRHFEANISCADCHRGLVHRPGSNTELPTRKICIKCHGREIDDVLGGLNDRLQ